MNNKTIIILILFIGLISVMVISIWGTLPENNNLPAIEQIEIIEYDELNEQGDKLIDVTDIVTQESNIFIVKFNIQPLPANTDSLTAKSSDPKVTVQLNILTGEVYVYYDMNSIITEKAVTIIITDQNTQVMDNVTLWFKPPGIIIIP